MEYRKIEILIKEILKVVKRTHNKLEKIEEKLNKLENRMINIKIQQKTLISIGKDPKHIRGTTGKVVEQIIFRKISRKNNKKEVLMKKC